MVTLWKKNSVRMQNARVFGSNLLLGRRPGVVTAARRVSAAAEVPLRSSATKVRVSQGPSKHVHSESYLSNPGKGS